MTDRTHEAELIYRVTQFLTSAEGMGAENAGVPVDDLRELIALASRTPPLSSPELIEKLVREAYEEGVEDGIGWHAYPESGPQPQWIDSVARVELLKFLDATQSVSEDDTHD